MFKLLNQFVLFIMLIFTISACESQKSGGCCKECTTGKPCGDTCIAKEYECHIDGGCACMALYNIGTVVPQVETKCMNDIVGLEYESGNESGYIDQNGYFNNEVGKALIIKFLGSNLIKTASDMNNSSNSFISLLKDTEKFNILRLMLTLDIDRYPYNGITIDKDIIIKLPLNFSQSQIDFENDKNVLTVLEAYGKTSNLIDSNEVSSFIQYSTIKSNEYNVSE